MRGRSHEQPRRRRRAQPARSAAGLLALRALGVAFGDIGTNVLFALRAAFLGPAAVPPRPENVLGVVSLFFWALVLIVSVKYLGFVLRADHRGEGGTFALLALAAPPRRARRRKLTLATVALAGAALLFGDGAITPAISVLAAVEGLGVATPALRPAVLPAASLILVALFAAQRYGTGRLGSVFGPVMLLWFLTLATLGAPAVARHPEILGALNPARAFEFLLRAGPRGLLTLGAVVLAVAGAEALYADLGHFGRTAIRRAWFAVAFPALCLNYFGQGALLLADPGAVQHPFYALVPGGARLPITALATAATIIASQTLIAGAFSLAHQAVQLGYLPRLTVVHTSRRLPGQIYIPEVNWTLLAAVLALVLGFRASVALAAAYGATVIGTMLTTSLLFYRVTRVRWRWSAGRAAAIAGAFVLIDAVLLAGNLGKLLHGAWVPLAIGGALFAVMTTWRRGSESLAAKIAAESPTVEEFLDALRRARRPRLPGTGAFLTPDPRRIPAELHHAAERLHVVYRRIVLLSVLTADVPRVPERRRVQVRPRGNGLWQVVATYGFAQTPSWPDLLHACPDPWMRERLERAVYILGRTTILPTGRVRMARWRKRLFAFLWRNARPAAAAFRIPSPQVVELGMEVEL